MSIRLNKVLTELNIGLQTAVDFLKNKKQLGDISDDASLSTKISDEQYKEFYRKLYPMQDEPLFWIHLNVDYPFNLTGILYFPKIKSNIDLQRNKIQL